MAYLTKKTYKEKLLDPRWQKKRLEILQRDNFRCVRCCNDQQTLHVHHYTYHVAKEPWDVDNDTLGTLCATCHSIEHIDNIEPADEKILLKLRVLLASGYTESLMLLREILLIILKKYQNG